MSILCGSREGERFTKVSVLRGSREDERFTKVSVLRGGDFVDRECGRDVDIS